MAVMAVSIIKTIFRIVEGATVVGILTLGYSMYHNSQEQSISYGENKAALEYKTGQLTDAKTENDKIKAENSFLLKQIEDLRQQVLAEQVNTKYTKKLLDEADAKSEQLEKNVALLTSALRNADPCAPLREDIRKLEEELQTPDYMSNHLNPAQREQAQSSLDKKYKSLDVCQGSRR
jgi:chromosome segregation ATPase